MTKAYVGLRPVGTPSYQGKPKDTKLPSIIAVAIMGFDGQVVALPKPCRHHHVIAYMAGELGHPVPIEGEQGFLTHSGCFVDRKAAKQHAVMNKQLITSAMDLDFDELYSEDVW